MRLWRYVLLVLYYLAISTLYAVMAVVRHNRYQTFADLGIFNQGIWELSRFWWPMTTITIFRPFWGAHFHPILVTLVPFYWLFPNERVLLVLQPFIILSAVVPLFLMTDRLTKSVFFGWAIILAYSFYLPLQRAIFTDFHEIVFIPPLLSWAYYFFLTGRKSLVALFFLLLLLVKEEVGFLVAAFAFYLIFSGRNWRRFGVVWLMIGVAYSAVIIKLFLPAVGGSYLFLPGQPGISPLAILFNSPIKINTLNLTFQPFAYLPLLSPWAIVVSLEQFLTRFANSNYTSPWTLGFHYSAPMAAIAAIGTIWSVGFLKKITGRYQKIIVVLAAVVLLVITRVEQVGQSAVLLFKRPEFWARAAWMDDLDSAVRLVPKDSSVATQENVLSHLSTRREIYNLASRQKAEYILADLRPDQYEYNYIAPLTSTILKAEIEKQISAGKYQVIFNHGGIILVKRKNV